MEDNKTNNEVSAENIPTFSAIYLTNAQTISLTPTDLIGYKINGLGRFKSSNYKDIIKVVMEAMFAHDGKGYIVIQKVYDYGDKKITDEFTLPFNKISWASSEVVG